MERENDNAKVQIGGKYTTYPKVDKSSLFLSIYRSLHTDDKDFNSVFDWFVNVQVLNLEKSVLKVLCLILLDLKCIQK